MKLGIVGLPNVGKSTLFNAITSAGVPADNYAFCTIDPNVGVVSVPDERLEWLREAHQPKKFTPAVIEFVDIAGLVKGASKGEGLGNKFLSNIRTTDAIVHVVRCFDDPNVTHVEGSTDPLRDIDIINLELILADAEMVTRRVDKAQKAAKGGDKRFLHEVEVFQGLLAHLNEGQLARTYDCSDDDRALIATSDLLTLKRPFTPPTSRNPGQRAGIQPLFPEGPGTGEPGGQPGASHLRKIGGRYCRARRPGGEGHVHGGTGPAGVRPGPADPVQL